MSDAPKKPAAKKPATSAAKKPASTTAKKQIASTAKPSTSQNAVASATATAAATVQPTAVASQSTGRGLAITALILAIVAIVFAAIPFVTLGAGLFILAALILSIIAMVKRAGSKGQRITALVLSIVAIPVNVIMFITTFAIVIGAGGMLTQGSVATALEESISNRIGFPVTVDCSSALVAADGTEFECEVTDPSSGETAIVTVAYVDGQLTWQILGL